MLANLQGLVNGMSFVDSFISQNLALLGPESIYDKDCNRTVYYIVRKNLRALLKTLGHNNPLEC